MLLRASVVVVTVTVRLLMQSHRLGTPLDKAMARRDLETTLV